MTYRRRRIREGSEAVLFVIDHSGEDYRAVEESQLVIDLRNAIKVSISQTGAVLIQTVN